MKNILFIVILGSFIVEGCARRLHDPDEVVEQEYIHRYGVPVQEDNWQSQGSTGQVVSTLKSGVTVTRTYQEGALEGETTYTFPHSELIEKRELYTNNVLQKETNFYRNGTPWKQLDHPTQSLITWYDNGVTQSAEVLDRGLIVKGEYYDITHRLDSKIEDANGLRTRRDAFGNMLGVDTFLNGDVIVTKTFHLNGAIKEVIPKMNGKVEGEVKSYLPDGVPVAIETWAQGEKTGPTLMFENGEMVAEIPYIKGVKNGIERRFREDSSNGRNDRVVAAEISWVEDSLHGPYISYVGDMTKTDYFYQGKPVTRTVYDKMTYGFDPYATR